MDGTHVRVVKVMLLATLVCAGCRGTSPRPVVALRNGLNSYLVPGSNEPVDDRENMARMGAAIEEIRCRRIVEGIPVLLDVSLMYDSTDNTVADAARQTLVEFGPRALSIIEKRISEEKKNNPDHLCEVPILENLKKEIVGKQSSSP